MPPASSRPTRADGKRDSLSSTQPRRRRKATSSRQLPCLKKRFKAIPWSFWAVWQTAPSPSVGPFSRVTAKIKPARERIIQNTLLPSWGAKGGGKPDSRGGGLRNWQTRRGALGEGDGKKEKSKSIGLRPGLYIRAAARISIRDGSGGPRVGARAASNRPVWAIVHDGSGDTDLAAILAPPRSELRPTLGRSRCSLSGSGLRGDANAFLAALESPGTALRRKGGNTGIRATQDIYLAAHRMKVERVGGAYRHICTTGSVSTRQSLNCGRLPDRRAGKGHPGAARIASTKFRWRNRMRAPRFLARQRAMP